MSKVSQDGRELQDLPGYRPLSFLIAFFRANVVRVLSLAIFGGFLGFVIGWLTMPVYQASVILIPAGDESSSGGLLNMGGAFGDIAAVAGLSSTSSNVVEAVETLNSRSFAEQLVEGQGIAERVLTPTGLTRFFGREELTPELEIQRAAKRFQEEILDVTEDSRTGIVYLSVFWIDRHEAAVWANLAADLVNDRLRQEALAESRRKLTFLESEINTSSIVGVRDTIYGIIENELKAAMLASARKEFAFRVIDPAIPPEEGDTVRPRHFVLVLVGLILGTIIAYGYCLARLERLS